jgi:hypothetical protein
MARAPTSSRSNAPRGPPPTAAGPRRVGRARGQRPMVGLCLPVLSENHIRTYWWCGPARTGMPPSARNSRSMASGRAQARSRSKLTSKRYATAFQLANVHRIESCRVAKYTCERIGTGLAGPQKMLGGLVETKAAVRLIVWPQSKLKYDCTDILIRKISAAFRGRDGANLATGLGIRTVSLTPQLCCRASRSGETD